MSPTSFTRSPLERLALGLCLFFLLAFIVNVVAGRLSVTQGWDTSWRLDRVAEFLLLLATAVCFAAASLFAEQRDLKSNPHQPTDA
jgi:hypothetical protein